MEKQLKLEAVGQTPIQQSNHKVSFTKPGVQLSIWNEQISDSL